MAAARLESFAAPTTPTQDDGDDHKCLSRRTTDSTTSQPTTPDDTDETRLLFGARRHRIPSSSSSTAITQHYSADEALVAARMMQPNAHQILPSSSWPHKQHRDASPSADASSARRTTSASPTIRAAARRKVSLLGVAMFTILATLVNAPIAAQAFQLDGSQNSFAQFRKWYTGLNGSLEFEFKTEQPNGLILYTDDGGTFDFFEIKLVEGAVRLRYNLGGGANIITVGRELHEGHWHKVQVSAAHTMHRLCAM